MGDGQRVRRTPLVVAAATLLGVGVWSSSALAAPASAPSRDVVPATVVEVDVDAPVCTAEQTEAVTAPDAAAAETAAGTTIVSFTLVDPRCAP
jgi:hypothetical protein